MSGASLQAVGTASEPVVFTAWTDDSFGGDSNGDLDATTPTPGLLAPAVLHGCGCEPHRARGGALRRGGLSPGNVYIESSTTDVVSSVIEHSSLYGFDLWNGQGLIEGNRICGQRELWHAVCSNASSPTIRGNEIDANGNHGIFGGVRARRGSSTTRSRSNAGARGAVRGEQRERRDGGAGADRQRGNGEQPLGADSVLERTERGVGQRLHGQYARPGGDRRQQPVTQPDAGAGGLLAGERAWRGCLSGVQLRLQPGVVWKSGASGSTDERLEIEGALTAVGTQTDKIVFTSYRDDSAGGDTNDNGASGGAARRLARGAHRADGDRVPDATRACRDALRRLRAPTVNLYIESTTHRRGVERDHGLEAPPVFSTWNSQSLFRRQPHCAQCHLRACTCRTRSNLTIRGNDIADNDNHGVYVDVGPAN